MFSNSSNKQSLWDKISNRHQKNTLGGNNNSALYNAISNETQGKKNSLSGSSVFGQYGADVNNENPSGGGAILNAIGTFTNSGSSGGGSGGGTPWAMIGGLAKSGYNSITGKDDQDYSDTEESVIYPLQGASMGAQFGPWGAAGGALYGLGYSLKDDMGLKDSNFFTKLLYPIDMGGDYADWLSL